MSALKLSLLAAMTLSTLSAAQLYTCFGDMEPDWDFADALWAGVSANNPDGLCWTIGSPDCAVFKDDNAGNAIISFCPPENNGQTDNCTPIANLNTEYGQLRNCAERNAGAETHNSFYKMNCFNNPDYTQGMRKRSNDSIVPVYMTKEEVDALMEKAKHSSGSPSLRRTPSMRIDKRQQEGDDQWFTDYKEVAIEKPGDERTITGRLPSGSSYMIQESDSQTFSISTEVTISAGFFDLFEASVGISVGADFTTTTTVGVTVAVDCPSGQEGVVVFRTRYDHYVGFWSPSGDRNEVWIPTQEAGSEFASGNYAVVCQG